MADLLFRKLAPASTDLVFGDTGEVASVVVIITGQFAPLSFSAQVARLAPVRRNIALTGQFSPPTFSTQVTYLPPARRNVALTGSFAPLTVAALVERLAIDRVNASVTGTFAPLRVSVLFAPLALVNVTGNFAPLTVAASTQYRSNTSRPTVGQTANQWQQAASAPAGVATALQNTQANPVGWAGRWQRATPAAVDLRHLLPEAFKPSPTAWSAPHQTARPERELRQFASQNGDRTLRLAIADAYEAAARLRHATLFGHQDGNRTQRGNVDARWQIARPTGQRHTSSFQPARPSRIAWLIRWQEAMRPPHGITLRPVAPPPPERIPSADLLFACPPWLDGPVDLLFGRVCGVPDAVVTAVVPIQRVYIVLNNITLHRVDTGAELHAHSFSMSLDYQSWTWSWQASLHADAAAHLGRDAQGDPAEVLAQVNGTPFRLRLVTIARDRRFSPTRWSVSGQGKAAILAAPWAPKLSFGNPSAERTAQQLAADVLTINGVGIGWTVDWRLADWQVPAGAWALQGSYIDAINDIAEAAGGYVQPHPTASVLRVLPRYPAPPWAWSSITPDFEIPEDAAEIEGTQYVDRPVYNRVFVGGVGEGVFGPFTRAGTAGNKIAPQATHPLITDAPAHRQRGIAALSDTGRQEHITLSMQVLPETGVIVPGQFVRYLSPAPKLGIVRSTSIDWSRPKLRQTIKLETHA